MIYHKTARGHKVLQDRSIPLAPRHRMIFILFDGKTSTADILKSTAGLGVERSDVLDLIELGLIEPIPTDFISTQPALSTTAQSALSPFNDAELNLELSSTSPFNNSSSINSNSNSNSVNYIEPQKVPNANQANQFDLDAEVKKMRYQNAYPLAVQITSNLGLGGFRLNLAIEQAMGYEDLVALLPRIEKAAGQNACAKLHEILLQPITL